MKNTPTFRLLNLLTAALLAIPLATHASTGPCDPATPISTQTVDTCFWDTFNNAKYDQIDAAKAFIQKAYEAADPQNWHARATRLGYDGWLSLWQASERTKSGLKGQQIFAALSEARSDFGLAYSLLPDTVQQQQEVLPAILAGFWAASTQAFGHALANSPDPDSKRLANKLIAQGNQLMENALQDYPWFNVGTQIATTTGHPSLIPAVDVKDIWRIVIMCSQVDEGFEELKTTYADYLNHQSFKKFAKLPSLATIKNAVCLNPQVAPYNYQTTFLLLGDIMYSECVQKGNQAAVCQGREWTKDDIENLWGYAKRDPHAYKIWPHRNALDQRLKSFSLKTHATCMTCHQKPSG